MSTPEQVTQRARSARLAFVSILSVLLVLSLVSIWLIFRGSPDAEEESSSVSPEEEAGFFVPHSGDEREQGRPVKFPRSGHGAASAYLAYLSAVSTADADALLQVHRTYRGADISQDSIDTTLSYRAGQIEWEKEDHMPFDEDSWPELDEGAYWFIDPQGVRWEKVDTGNSGPDLIEVQVLAVETASDGRQAYFERMEIHYDLLMWDEGIGDWQVRSPLASHQFTDAEHSPEHDRWQLIKDEDE